METFPPPDLVCKNVSMMTITQDNISKVLRIKHKMCSALPIKHIASNLTDICKIPFLIITYIRRN